MKVRGGTQGWSSVRGWGSVEVAEEFLSTELSPPHPRLWRMVVEVRGI